MASKKSRFRTFKRGETTADVFALPAWKVKQLTGREKARYGDIYAPIKYKDHLGKLTKRVSIISRSSYRTKYTHEKFNEMLSPGAAAKRRKEGSLGYTSQTAARQARKTPIGRRINLALATPNRETLETPYGVNDRGRVWKNSGDVYTFPHGFDKGRRRELLRKALFEGQKIDPEGETGDWFMLRDWLATIGHEELYNMIDGRHYRQPETTVLL